MFEIKKIIYDCKILLNEINLFLENIVLKNETIEEINILINGYTLLIYEIDNKEKFLNEKNIIDSLNEIKSVLEITILNLKDLNP